MAGDIANTNGLRNKYLVNKEGDISFDGLFGNKDQRFEA